MRVRQRVAGFTLIELLTVMAILALLMGIGFPALMNTMRRAKLQGGARQASVMLQIARAEAIKRGVRAGVTLNYTTNEVIGFVDVDFDVNPGFTAGDRELGRYPLPKGVTLYGPGDAEGGPHTDGNWGSAGDGVGFVENAALEGTAFFRPDGGADREGAFRMKDDRQPVANYLEIRVAPAGTARIAVKKFEGGDPADPDSWEEPGEGDGWEWN